MTEIQGKSILVRVSARFELARVRVIGRLQPARIFAYSSTREQSNKRSGMRLKTESETGESCSLGSFSNRN